MISKKNFIKYNKNNINKQIILAGECFYIRIKNKKYIVRNEDLFRITERKKNLPGLKRLLEKHSKQKEVFSQEIKESKIDYIKNIITKILCKIKHKKVSDFSVSTINGTVIHETVYCERCNLFLMSKTIRARNIDFPEEGEV
jgi:hypothetical protein